MNLMSIFDPATWEKYGLAGLFGLALVAILAYLLSRFIPRMFAEFRAELAEERNHAAAQEEKRREVDRTRHEETTRRDSERHAELMQAIADTRHEVKDGRQDFKTWRAVEDAKRARADGDAKPPAGG